MENDASSVTVEANSDGLRQRRDAHSIAILWVFSNQIGRERATWQSRDRVERSQYWLPRCQLLLLQKLWPLEPCGGPQGQLTRSLSAFQSLCCEIPLLPLCHLQQCRSLRIMGCVRETPHTCLCPHLARRSWTYEERSRVLPSMSSR